MAARAVGPELRIHAYENPGAVKTAPDALKTNAHSLPRQAHLMEVVSRSANVFQIQSFHPS